MVEKIVEVEVEAEPVEEVLAGGECCDAYNIGITRIQSRSTRGHTMGPTIACGLRTPLAM